MKSVVHRNRGRVVIAAIASPILLDRSHVQIPALNFPAPGCDSLHRSLRESKRSESGRSAYAFLGARKTSVYSALINVQRLCAERRDGIHDEMTTSAVGQIAQAGYVLPYSGRGLGNDDCQYLRLTRIDRLLYPGHLYGLSPFAPDRNDLCAGAFGHLVNTLPTVAADADDDLVFRLDQIDQGGLHPGASGSRNRKSHWVVGLERVPEHRFYFIHTLQEERVEMTQDRGSHRSTNSLLDRTRARA